MWSVSVSACRCCMFVSCVHPVAVLNAAFCMTCSLLMLIGDHTEEACSIGSHVDPGMSLKCVPTRVCRKSAHRPWVCR